MTKHDPNKTINLGKRPGPSEPQHRPDGVPNSVWESQQNFTSLQETNHPDDKVRGYLGTKFDAEHPYGGSGSMG